MSFKKGDIVTVSNKFEEYMGTALVVYKDDEKVDIKIIDVQTGSKDALEGGILLRYESNNSIFAAYCDILEISEDTGVIKLRIYNTLSVINRRFSTRYPAFIKVDISPLELNRTFEGVIRNMSLRGFMVNTNVDLDVNTFVKLSIEFEGHTVDIKARIERKNVLDGNYIYGLCAVDLDYNQKIIMRSIITELKECNRKLTEQIIKDYIGN